MRNPFPKSRVLIVDDDTNIQSSLGRLLVKEGFVVEVADDGEEALPKMDDFKPHCILLDIKMPYLNGKEVLKIIKFSRPDVAVIILSGVNNFNTYEDCVTDGAFCWIPKPVSFEFLLTQIIQALELGKIREARND